MFNIIRADRAWNVYKFPAELIAWRDEVIAVDPASRPSLQEMMRKNRLIHGKMVSGAWALTDDMVDLGGENEVQALVSLKRRFLCLAINDAQHAPGVGFSIDGYTQYVEWPFVPATHAVAMTTTNQRLAAYVLTNYPSNDSALASYTADDNRFNLRPGSSTVMAANLCAPNVVTFSLGTAPVDHSGWSVASRNGATGMRGYKNGARLTDATGLTLSPNLPTRPMKIGSNTNSDGAEVRLLTSTIMYAELGGQLSDPQEAAVYAGILDLAAARGVATV